MVGNPPPEPLQAAMFFKYFYERLDSFAQWSLFN